MNLYPNSQTNLYGLQDNLLFFAKLFDQKRLPSKILLTGQKGIGKCTLAYHLINFVLSKDEEMPYDLAEFKINLDNRSFKLIQNGSCPNFNLIDINPDKKNIDIEQIRELIIQLNKSSFNNKPRFVLIDNIEYLNLNSVNALLKTLEEPNENIFFILINSNKKIIPTLLSRCINFNISLENDKVNEISSLLFDNDIDNLLNKDLLNYYSTPGEIYNLLKFSEEKKIDLKEINLKDFLLKLISENIYEDDNAYYHEGSFRKTLRAGMRDGKGIIKNHLIQINKRESVLGSKGRSGDQWDIWQAVYSPVGENGYPKPIWDKLSGEIDKEVANYWKENYDLRHIMQRDWDKIGKDLEGKINIYCGDMDNYYLNNAVVLTEEFLESTKTPYYGGEVDYGNNAEHCWNGDQENPNYISRLRYNTMYLDKIKARLKKTAPKNNNLKNWGF